MLRILKTAIDFERTMEKARPLLGRFLENTPGCGKSEFFATYEAHREGILAYFEERKSSGVVEGLNNKARVITKRCYGVKKAKTLWQRLCLDINIAAQVLQRSVQKMKTLTQRIRAQFLGYYT